MKKLMLSLVLILVLLVAAVYIFIPAQIKVSAVKKIGASEPGTARLFLDSSWTKWWGADDSTGNSFSAENGVYICNGSEFRLAKLLHMSADITITHNEQAFTSRALVIAKTTDTSVIQWQLTLDGGSNPIERFKNYRTAVALKKNIDNVINRFRHFVEKPENVYGITLARTSIKDTLFISKKASYSYYPHTAAIYEQVAILKTYAEKNGAQQISAPIYHITRIDSNHYELMTAVPINKKLDGDATFTFKRMIPGSFIVAEVKGGEQAVETASRNLDQFFEDYNKTAMAISFRMLLTNRLETPDSTQWVTRLYHPVY